MVDDVGSSEGLVNSAANVCGLGNVVVVELLDESSLSGMADPDECVMEPTVDAMADCSWVWGWKLDVVSGVSFKPEVDCAGGSGIGDDFG